MRWVISFSDLHRGKTPGDAGNGGQPQGREAKSKRQVRPAMDLENLLDESPGIKGLKLILTFTRADESRCHA